MTVGQEMRKAREKRGLTQLQVAEKLGKTQPTVASWEADESSPYAKEVRDVAFVYGLKPEQLLPPRSITAPRKSA